MPSNRASPLQAEFLQLAPAQAQALSDELAQGLLQPQPSIAPKFLYDALGSKLFEAITELDEYYPTRTEAAIFERHRDELAQACGGEPHQHLAGARWVEFELFHPPWTAVFVDDGRSTSHRHRLRSMRQVRVMQEVPN